MKSYRRILFRGLGVIGTLACLLIFGFDPSWPTPDKLLVLLTCIFMIFGQAVEMLKRIGPMVGVILVYDYLRGLATINTNVHYMMMPNVDRLFSETLPTTFLQNLLWQGHAVWYDFVLYIVYMLHFVLPLGLAVLVWKFRTKEYWRISFTYVVVSFAGFFTFLAYPAAPPWMASDHGYIPHVARISSEVFVSLGINDFPSIYNKIAPNTVAAVPSLHAAYAMLLALFVFKLFGRKWGAVACIYPFLIWFGTVYMADHYVIDELLGIVYALVGYKCTYWFADAVWPRLVARHQWAKAKWQARLAAG
jgi:hypothetical protein